MLTAAPGASPMPLLKLLDASGLDVCDIQGNPGAVVTGISVHAQKVERNNLFAAVRGACTDSHMLVSDAVSRGASAVVVERDIPPYPGVAIVRVPDTREAIGRLAQAFQGHPARAMTVAGVTGTNGKTTVSSMIRAIMDRAGKRTGWIGTLGAWWNDERHDTGVTTPGPLELASILSAMDRDRVDFVVMEVSSHAIDQKRVAGLPFHAGVLTNVTQDHLDYHGDLPTYVGVKRRFFFDYVRPTPGSTACFNQDDLIGEELYFSYDGCRLGFSAMRDDGMEIHGRNACISPSGTSFELMAGRRGVRVNGQVVAHFNLSNMLAAATACHALGVDLVTIAEGLESFPGVSGRFERVRAGQPFLVLVDYAHTPDALQKALAAARRLTCNRLIVVFGCGGNRDRTKRAPMGEVAGRLADQVVLTSDNPRFEDPDLIARMAEEGLRRSGIKPACTRKILDRAEAIEVALAMAEPGDCVLIAGKGHEDYQEIDGCRIDFDDRETARRILRQLHPNGREEAPGGAGDSSVRTIHREVILQ